MSSRREQRKQEERKVEELIRDEEARLAPSFCVFCDREINHESTSTHLKPIPTMRPFREMPVCYQCHQELRHLHKDRALARDLETVEAVKAHPQFEKYLKWIKKAPSQTIYSWLILSSIGSLELIAKILD